MKSKKQILFIGKRLLRVITLLIAVCIVSFLLVSFSPVDPVQQYVGSVPNVSSEQREKIAEYWRLNEPISVRFLNWGKAIIKGDFGTSYIYRRPVWDIIKEKFAASFALMSTSWILSGIMGVTLGCIMGLTHRKWTGRLLKKICLVMCSIPTFWIGIVLIMFFSVQLGWFPMGMSVPAGIPSSEVTILQKIHHLILPALTLSFLSFANVALHTREKLIDVMESEYVLFAKARGESTGSILKRHGLRNIMLPALTMQFASFSELFGGSVLAETVFSYPGLGAAAAAAGIGSDIPLLLGITIFSTLFVFAGNMTADILYGIVDPQIRIGGKT